jgi:hypothetical protein
MPASIFYALVALFVNTTLWRIRMTRGRWVLVTCFAGGISACAGGSPQTQTVPDASSTTILDASTTADGPAYAYEAAVQPEADATASIEAGPDASPDGGLATVAPSTLDFGLVNCGSPTPAAAQTFTINNPGASPVTWTAALGKGMNSAFTIAPAMGSLPAGQSAMVTVTPLLVPQTSSTSGNALGDLVNVTLNSSSVNVTLQETPQGSVLVFNPTSVPFGSTPLGSPLTTYFDVKNVGNLPIDDVTLTLTGDPSFTLPSATTGETLMADAGASPQSSVTFAPTTTSPVSGSVAITTGPSDVLCGPLPPPLALSGTGTSGKVVVSPTTVIFSPDGVNQFVPCGQSALPVMVTIQNIGNAFFDWTATLLHGNGTFYTVAPTSGAVSPMSTETVTITPKVIPNTSSTTPDAFSDTLTITTNAAMDMPHTVALHETAQGAIISRSLNSLGFGNVADGTTSTQSYTFSNTGNVDATLTLTNGNPAFVQTNPLTVNAGAGVFATESVSFQPNMTQSYSDIGVLALETPIPLCGTLPGNLTLSGNGSNPTVTATPATLNFGSIPCGTAPMNPVTVNITNNGPATTFTAVLLKGLGSLFTAMPASGNLSAGQVLPITVTGSAIPATASTSSNAFGDTLEVTTASNNVVDVTLNMTALGAVLSFSKASIAFGPTPPNTPVTSGFTVGNAGNVAAAVTLTTSLPVFTMAPASGTVGAGTSLPITGSFDPTSTTPPSYSGTLSMTVPMSTPLCSPLPVAIPLTGSAN